jgi:multidrug efflux system outer membrane protein
MSKRSLYAWGRRAGALLSALFLAACGLLSACGSLPTDRLPWRHVPPRATVTGIDAPGPVTAGTGEWPVSQWWLSYGDTQLDELVAAARRVSPTMQAAQSRMAQVAANLRLATAERVPTVEAYAQAQRQRLSDNGLFPAKLFGFNWYSLAEFGVDLKVDPDIGGKKAAERRAVMSRLLEARAGGAAAELAVVRAVVTTYYAWQVDAARKRLVQERIELIESEQRLTATRVAAELARADEMHVLVQARLNLIDQAGGIETAMNLQRVALAALLNRRPDELATLQQLELPSIAIDVPTNAAIDLMARRPDLQAARARIDVDLANVDVARAGFFPNVDLRALMGLSSRTLANLLQSGSAIPQVAAAIHLPLFDAGRIRARYDGATAALQTAITEYHGSVINAAREVNEALVTRDANAAHRDLHLRITATAEKLQQLTDERLAAGLTDARPTLVARRAVLESRETDVLATAALLSSDLDLIHALGGGYTSATGASNER